MQQTFKTSTMLTSYCCDNSVDVDEELLQIHAKSQHIQSDEAVILRCVMFVSIANLIVVLESVDVTIKHTKSKYNGKRTDLCVSLIL